MPNPRHRYVYISDGAAQYTVVLSETVASEGGFALGDGAQGPLPGSMRMRHVHFKDDSGVRKRDIPFASVSSPYIELTSTFTYDGSNFRATGRTGERLTAGPI